jgi:DNA-directed RNA polymerase specialized sigma24 family protein
MDRKLEEIERAIDTLSPEQREELHLWLDEQYPQKIDDLLKADLDAGRMDKRIHRALADYKSGKTKPL